MNRLIAISGGIGSGKSVVSRVVEAMGFDVYDCDSRAKTLMDGSDRIKGDIASMICRDVILPDGSIDRRRLAAEVFADSQKLDALNEIVHSAVRDDLRQWSAGREIAFVETAILYQSGLDRMVDEVWEVVAPKEIRILRVINRNSMSRDEVESRINVQDSFKAEYRHPIEFMIVNDGDMAVLPQIERLISEL